MTKPAIDGASIVRARPDQVSTELGSETVILGVEAGRYFGLNEVGARIWTLLQEPIAVSALCSTLLSEYEVGPKELEQDVLDVLGELEEQGLIHVQPAPGTP